LTRKQRLQVEGERKAVFEDCESEKAANKEKIKKLKAEVKKLQVKKRFVEVKQLKEKNVL
jgi:hypothetical protein